MSPSGRSSRGTTYPGRRTCWPTTAGLTGALSQASRMRLSRAAARGSASSSTCRLSALMSLNGSQPGGISRSQVIVRAPAATGAAADAGDSDGPMDGTVSRTVWACRAPAHTSSAQHTPCAASCRYRGNGFKAVIGKVCAGGSMQGTDAKRSHGIGRMPRVCRAQRVHQRSRQRRPSRRAIHRLAIRITTAPAKVETLGTSANSNQPSMAAHTRSRKRSDCVAEMSAA